VNNRITRSAGPSSLWSVNTAAHSLLPDHAGSRDAGGHRSAAHRDSVIVIVLLGQRSPRHERENRRQNASAAEGRHGFPPLLKGRFCHIRVTLENRANRDAAT